MIHNKKRLLVALLLLSVLSSPRCGDEGIVDLMVDSTSMVEQPWHELLEADSVHSGIKGEVARRLLVSGCVRAHDEIEGFPIVQVAVWNRESGITRALAEHGASLRFKVAGAPPLSWAISVNDLEMVKVFLEHGVGAGERCDDGRSNFFCALNTPCDGRGPHILVEKLIESGESVFNPAYEGYTNAFNKYLFPRIRNFSNIVPVRMGLLCYISFCIRDNLAAFRSDRCTGGEFYKSNQTLEHDRNLVLRTMLLRLEQYMNRHVDHIEHKQRAFWQLVIGRNQDRLSVEA